MEKSVKELEEMVYDEATFLEFVRALIRDRENAVKVEAKKPSYPYGPDSGGWQNTTIETYLEAAVAWAEDSQFGRQMAFPEYEIGEANPWRRMASFLAAGRIYE